MHIQEIDSQGNLVVHKDSSTDLNSRHRMREEPHSNETLERATCGTETHEQTTSGEITITEVHNHEDGGATYTIAGMDETQVHEIVAKGVSGMISDNDHKVAQGLHHIEEPVIITLTPEEAQKCFEVGFCNILMDYAKMDLESSDIYWYDIDGDLDETDGDWDEYIDMFYTGGVEPCEEEYISQSERKRQGMMSTTDDDI